MRLCPPAEQLTDFLDDRLDDSERDTVAAHVGECPSCQAALERLTAGVSPTPAPRPDASFLDQLKQNAPTLITPGARVPAPGLPAIPGYEVLGELGRGGMGVVYRARQTRLDRLVALKTVLSGPQATAKALARFRAEADALARLQHPNIVQVFEVGEHEGRPYFALEFVPGGSLAERLAGAPQSPRDAAALVEVLARTMHAAHQGGVVHRDLKPANILLGNREQGTGNRKESGSLLFPKITDFGLAKRLDIDAGQTRTGEIMGTPSYMAPEQAVGRTQEVGPLADVYSLGAILYETLTGRPPFNAASPIDTLMQVVHQEPVPVSRLQPAVPRDLETVCLKCLEKEPARRYASAQDLAADLRRWLDGKPVAARPVGPAGQLWRWGRRNPLLAGTITAAALALLSAAVSAALYGVERGAAADQERRDKGQLQIAYDDLARRDEELRLTNVRREVALRQAADWATRQGVTLCEAGEVRQGLLWLARGLTTTPDAESSPQQQSLRRLLAGWSRSLPAPQAFLDHPATVGSAAFTPDGTAILVGDMDGRARLWDAATGRPRTPPLPHPGWVKFVAVSPDGRTLLTSNGIVPGQTRLWNAATGEPIGEPIGESAMTASFTPDSKLVLVGSGERLRVVDAATGRPSGPPLSFGGPNRAVVIAPDRRIVLAVGVNGQARLWEVGAGKAVGTAMKPAGGIQAAAFTADGKTAVTASGAGALQRWNMATGDPDGTPVSLTDGPLRALAAAPNGETLLAGGSRQGKGGAWLVEAATLRAAVALPHEDGPVEEVAYSADGSTLLTKTAKSLRCWDARTGLPLGPPLPLPLGGSGTALSPDGKLLLAADGSATRVWRLPAHRPVAVRRHAQSVFRVATSADGRVALSASSDGQLLLWDTATGQAFGDPLTVPPPVTAAGLSADGRTLFALGRDSFRCWQRSDGAPVELPLPHPQGIRGAAFSPDGTILATGNKDGTARLWSLPGGALTGEPLRHPAPVRAVAFSPDGNTLLTGCDDGQARRWDRAAGQVLGEPCKHGRPVVGVALDPTGAVLLTNGEMELPQLRLWAAADGRPLGGPLAATFAGGFSPDGRRLLAGRGQQPAHFFDTTTAEPVGGPLPISTGALALSRDGQVVVAGERWLDAATLLPLGPLLGREPFYAATLAADGRTLVVGGAGRTAQVWRVPVPIEGSVERLALWVEVLTGLEVRADLPQPMDAREWRERRERLDALGGAPESR